MLRARRPPRCATLAFAAPASASEWAHPVNIVADPRAARHRRRTRGDDAHADRGQAAPRSTSCSSAHGRLGAGSASRAVRTAARAGCAGPRSARSARVRHADHRRPQRRHAHAHQARPDDLQDPRRRRQAPRRRRPPGTSGCARSCASRTPRSTAPTRSAPRPTRSSATGRAAASSASTAPTSRSLIPGRPSHGCIRVRNADMARLYRLTPIGTPITAPTV